jgi:hypothetical protein
MLFFIYHFSTQTGGFKVKKNLFLLMVSLFFLSPSITWAENAPINVFFEWGFTPPSNLETTGFNLYCNGELKANFNGGETREGTASFPAEDQGKWIFNLTATYADGTESPYSSPFTLSEPDSSTTIGSPINFRAQVLK